VITAAVAAPISAAQRRHQVDLRIARQCRHDHGTVELGVTIADAAVDGDVTVVVCDLFTEGRQHCPGCGSEGSTVTRRAQSQRCARCRASLAAARSGTAVPLNGS
jgi:hypothetical protein